MKLENFQATEEAKPASERNDRVAIEQEQLLAIFALQEEQKAKLAELDAQEIASDELKRQLKNNIIQEGANKELEIERKTVEAKKALQQKQLQSASMLFGGIAELAETFGREGFIAAKAAAIAQATVNTILAVTAALTAGPYIGIALAAVTAALGAVQIAKIAGVSFADGGMVPGAPSRTDNRLAAVASGEYIFDSKSVQRAGPGYFAALHDSIRRGTFTGYAGGGLVPKAVTGSSFALGGLVGSIEQQRESPDNSVNFGFVDTRNQERQFLRGEGARILIDQMQRRGNRVYS